jgi:hypothetical protein
VLLHERARDAARTGNALCAAASARAVRFVEVAMRAAEGNTNPQRVSARLLGQLAEVGA